jgi:membrane protease YdiL (CAAX protease family)
VPDWSAFAGVTGVVLTLLLALARLSQTLAEPSDCAPAPGGDGDYAGVDAVPEAADADGTDDGTTEVPDPRERARGDDTERTQHLRAGALLANVAVSQGAFAVLLLFGAWYAAVPASALGLGAAAFAPAVILAGLVGGVVLYVANEGGAAVGRRLGVEDTEAFRAALAPKTRRGWAILLLVVLPVVAGFEELLFRGALVGGLAAGFDVSPWLLAVLSSVAFALGHSAQGRVGMAVTGLLGFGLATLFVLTESLPAVVAAHYLVNALEFVVNER